DASLAVDVEIDGTAGEAEAETRGHAWREVAPAHRRPEQHETRRPAPDGIGEHRRVRVRRVGIEAVRTPPQPPTGPGAGKGGSVLFPWTDHDRLDPRVEGRRERRRLRQQLRG